MRYHLNNIILAAAPPEPGGTPNGDTLATWMKGWIAAPFWLVIAVVIGYCVIRQKMALMGGILLGALVFAVVLYSPDTLPAIAKSIPGVG